jgi:hypothetical protein
MKNQQIITATEVLTSINHFKNRKAKKSWLTRAISLQEAKLQDIVDKATLKGWKHYYGQPIHDNFLEVQGKQLVELMEARQRLEPKARRVQLPTIQPKAVIEDVIETLDLKVAKKTKTASKAVSKPKSAPKKQPKVDAQTEALTSLASSIAELTKQMSSLTEMVSNNSKAIAELQQPKVEKKVKKQPKVEQKKIEFTESDMKSFGTMSTALAEAVVKKESKKAQPKVAMSSSVDGYTYPSAKAIMDALKSK